jgi:hypothetical protein
MDGIMLNMYHRQGLLPPEAKQGGRIPFRSRIIPAAAVILKVVQAVLYIN